MLAIPISALATHWSDSDGDPVQLLNINTSSANGANNVSSDSAFIYYTPPNNLPDSITYTVADVRTNPPAVYRPGDTVQTDVGLVHLAPLPAIRAATANGSLILSVSNGSPGANSYLLGSTNLALPLSNWARLGTNLFDGNGNLSLTNPVDPNAPQQFYRLQLP